MKISATGDSDPQRTLGTKIAICGILAFSIWLFSVLYGFDILDPHRVDWLLQEDPAQAFFGLNYFLLEPLHWPWGSISTFNIPTGTSLVFTDAIPWLSLLVKCCKKLIPFDSPIQISGWWILVCLLLQGLFGFTLEPTTGLEYPSEASSDSHLRFRILHTSGTGGVGTPASPARRSDLSARFDRNRRQAFMEALWQRILKGSLMADEVIAAEKTEELQKHFEEVRKNPGVRIKDMGHYYLLLTR